MIEKKLLKELTKVSGYKHHKQIKKIARQLVLGQRKELNEALKK